MTTPMPELKPCPFCGGEASSSGVINYHEKHEAWFIDGTRITQAFYCNCTACTISNRGMLGHQTREKAIEKWNTRAAIAQPAQEGDAKDAGFIQKTNIEYAAWCRTYYQADTLDERGMKSLDGLWAWQAATLAAQRRPLTDAHLCVLLVNIDPETKRLPIGLKLFAREIEAAHGITATPQGKP